MKYTAKLTHYAFDNTYTNARLFASKAERDAYFVNLVGYTQNTLVNFNARDILATDIIVKVEPNAPLFNLLNYNYCIISGYTDNQIEKIDGIDRVKDGEQPTEVFYFFIKKSVQESGGQIRLYLENDIIQNYWYDIDFAECMINRAHLNRLEASTGNLVKFRGNADSDLFERENIKDVAKRLVSRQRLKMKVDQNATSNLNDWLYDNIFAWCYIFISQGEYNIFNFSTGTTEPHNLYYTAIGEDNNQINYSHVAICAPIYNSTSKIKISDANNTTYTIDAIQ